jgi:hypothetical protein
MPRCARRGCRREATEAHDVWSWFKPIEQQEPAHYEVCARHASYFAGSFDRTKSEAVKRDLTPWSPVVARAAR